VLGFEDFFSLDRPIEKITNAKVIKIDTPESFDFSLCIVCFKIKQELKNTFCIAMSQDSDKPILAGTPEITIKNNFKDLRSLQ